MNGSAVAGAAPARDEWLASQQATNSSAGAGAGNGTAAEAAAGNGTAAAAAAPGNATVAGAVAVSAARYKCPQMHVIWAFALVLICALSI